MLRWLLAFSILTGQVPRQSTGVDPWELGVRAVTTATGRITACRFYRWPGDPGPHVCRVWSATGAKLADVAFAAETASGWQEQALPSPVAVMAGGSFTTSVTNPAGSHYAALSGAFAGPLVDGPITYPASAGVYGPIGAYPRLTTPTSYFRDFIFMPDVLPTVVVTPDASVVGGFFADLGGFAAGGYTLGISIKNASGAIVGEIPIVLPLTTSGASAK